MAIEVIYNGQITINGVDLSDHAQVITVNRGQETREITAHGNVIRPVRAGLRNDSIHVSLWNDRSSTSVETTLRNLIGITSTGFEVIVRKINTARGPSNPEYTMTSIYDGDLSLMDDEVGEPSTIEANFLPYSGTGISVTTSSS